MIVLILTHCFQNCFIHKLSRYVTRNGQHINRHQLPFTVAYAMSIHKCQGVSVDRAIITTKDVFTTAQTYVAFSRVRSAAGLYLMDFDIDKVTTSRYALAEYNKLRARTGMPPLCDPKLTRQPRFDVMAKLRNETRRELVASTHADHSVVVTCGNVNQRNLTFATLIQCALLVDSNAFWSEVCNFCFCFIKSYHFFYRSMIQPRSVHSCTRPLSIKA